MSAILTDRGVVTLCTAVALLPAHAALVSPRAQRLVAAAGRRFLREGRLARIRPLHWAVVAQAAEIFRGAELSAASQTMVVAA